MGRSPALPGHKHRHLRLRKHAAGKRATQAQALFVLVAPVNAAIQPGQGGLFCPIVEFERMPREERGQYRRRGAGHRSMPGDITGKRRRQQIGQEIGVAALANDVDWAHRPVGEFRLPACHERIGDGHVERRQHAHGLGAAQAVLANQFDRLAVPHARRRQRAAVEVPVVGNALLRVAQHACDAQQFVDFVPVRSAVVRQGGAVVADRRPPWAASAATGRRAVRPADTGPVAAPPARSPALAEDAASPPRQRRRHRRARAESLRWLSRVRLFQRAESAEAAFPQAR